MPALEPIDMCGRVVWLGTMPIRDRTGMLFHASHSVAKVALSFAGIAGDDHAGVVRAACGRVRLQYDKGTPIRNVRQLTILSTEELDVIAAAIAIPALDPSWVGASMVVQGIPDFSHIPPSSRLQFGNSETNGANGATVTVDMMNLPCHLPTQVMDNALHTDVPESIKAFKAASKGRRGVTAWVEREGIVRVGDDVRVHIPMQRAWQGAQEGVQRHNTL